MLAILKMGCDSLWSFRGWKWPDWPRPGLLLPGRVEKENHRNVWKWNKFILDLRHSYVSKWGCVCAWGLCPTIQCATQRGFQYLDQRWNPLHEQGGPEGEKTSKAFELIWVSQRWTTCPFFCLHFFQIYETHPLPGRNLDRRFQVCLDFWCSEFSGRKTLQEVLSIQRGRSWWEGG